MRALSALKTKSNRSGTSSGRESSIAAPEMERSLIKQLTWPSANEIAADINTFLRGLARLSIEIRCDENLKFEKSARYARQANRPIAGVSPSARGHLREMIVGEPAGYGAGRPARPYGNSSRLGVPRGGKSAGLTLNALAAILDLA
jgi:hypothetical protein